MANLLDISPTQDTTKRWILDKIASGESPGYNVLYGGQTVSDLSQFPYVRHDLGNGQYTTAAGRYQFLAPTWQAEKSKLDLPDFSPSSQDAAAWDLANTTYKQQTGRSLMEDAKSNKVDWQALTGQWPSLGKPAATSASGSAAPPAAAAHPAGPSPFLRLAILQAAMPHIQLQPVDYDPFAVEPKLP